MKLMQLIALAFALVWTGAASADNDAPAPEAIRAVMHGMFDKPDMELVIDPIAVVDGFAVAGWTQGEMGGRAFLRERDGHWMLVLCTGDQIKSVEALTASGVPADTATRLAAEIATVEAGVDPARLAMFASFDGVVTMDEHSSH
jgi:hypothetical protein